MSYDTSQIMVDGWWRPRSPYIGCEEPLHFYLFRGEELKPIHVTSFRNGRVAGHNCWYTHCDNRTEEFITGMWPEQVQIGHRYMVNPWGVAVYEMPWRCARCGKRRYEGAPCRMTFHEPCGFKLGKTTAQCDDGRPVLVRLPVGWQEVQ